MPDKDSNEERQEIGELGEFGLIDHLTKDVELHQKSTVLGIGDDAAVIHQEGRHGVVSTDMLVEGIHFHLSYAPLKHIGYKAVVTNLSDIYAMNVYPEQITVSIAISNRFSVQALDELYDGIKTACRVYGVDLIGGDTTSSTSGLIISITAIGSAELKDIVYRSGAKPGDIMCVSGDLGAAYLGLQILERERQLYEAHPGLQPDLEDQKYLVRRQLKPEARRDVIDTFRKYKLTPTSMMDISDGLSSEIFHICKASQVGAFLEEGKVPIHPDAEKMALKFKMDPITCALSGGEDYELLFTVAEADLEKIRYMPSVYIIGEIANKKDGITLHTTGGNIHPLKAQGWQHMTNQHP